MLTYVGIGSCPHAATLAELTDEWDQMIPLFLRNTPSRIIHYDPAFERREEFLNEYFTMRGFLRSGSDWVSDTSTVTLHARTIEHPEDDKILLNHVEDAIRTRTKLVIQEFTGQELVPTLKALYAQTSSRKLFKRNVLIDMTYGTSCHCMTDMVKYKPLYTEGGDFVNMLLYDETETLSHIGESAELNELIKVCFMKKYLETVNLQVDYRRRRMGGTVMYPCEAYGNESTPDEIMDYLQRKLRPILNVFDTLGLMTEDKWAIVEKLFAQYNLVDMYKWNTTMREMVA
jgi:hypothetical protein